MANQSPEVSRLLIKKRGTIEYYLTEVLDYLLLNNRQ